MNQDIPRVTGLLIIEVRNSNPNGDPDRESDPRTRAHDGRGMISDVSFKRKLRELLILKDGPVWQQIASLMALKPESFEIHVDQASRDKKSLQRRKVKKSHCPSVTGTFESLEVPVWKRKTISFEQV